MTSGDIIRYVKVSLPDERQAWYYDEDDYVEQGDLLIVPYRRQETLGLAVQIVRCVYPYTVFPYEKTLPIFEIKERRGKPMTDQ